MFRHKRLPIVLFCLCALAPAAARAAVLPGYATGTGANTASVIIDFAFQGGDAYRFDYRYDGDATAQDMLLALDAAGGLTVHHQFFTLGGASSIFIDGFTFNGNTAVPGFEGSQGESWSYWVVDDRVAAPGFWTPSASGSTDRLLSDGSLDGWALNVSSFNQGGFEPTSNPPAIPEPGSALLLTSGVLLLARPQRRR